MIHDKVDEHSFLLYAAKNYDNPQCLDIAEFHDDLKRFKYLKRLFGKYEETGELRERLIINHLVILYNVFGDSATKMLFFRLQGYYSYLKPFLVLLNRMPETIHHVGNHDIIYSSDIPMDDYIVSVLRKI